MHNNKLIAHVSFVKYQYEYDASHIFSRHSSFVHKDYRNLGIYKKLCLFSYMKLEDSKKYRIITWPNKLNILSKPHTNFFFKKEAHYLFTKEYKISKKKHIYNSKNHLLKNIKKKDLKALLSLSQLNSNILSKNILYLKFRFQDSYKCKHYYDFFSSGNFSSIFIFSKLNSENKLKINILNYFGNFNIFINHLQKLINKLNFKKDYIIQIFISSANQNTINFLKKQKFQKHSNLFNIILLSNKSINDKETKYLRKSNISMADTDVFIPFN